MPQTAETQILITGEDQSKQAFRQAEQSLNHLNVSRENSRVRPVQPHRHLD